MIAAMIEMGVWVFWGGWKEEVLDHDEQCRPKVVRH